MQNLFYEVIQSYRLKKSLHISVKTFSFVGRTEKISNLLVLELEKFDSIFMCLNN